MRIVIAFLLFALTNGYNVPPAEAVARRQAMGAIFGGSLAFLAAPAVNALDMDAFANSQVKE